MQVAVEVEEDWIKFVPGGRRWLKCRSFFALYSRFWSFLSSFFVLGLVVFVLVLLDLILFIWLFLLVYTTFISYRLNYITDTLGHLVSGSYGFLVILLFSVDFFFFLTLTLVLLSGLLLFPFFSRQLPPQIWVHPALRQIQVGSPSNPLTYQVGDNDKIILHRSIDLIIKPAGEHSTTISYPSEWKLELQLSGELISLYTRSHSTKLISTFLRHDAQIMHWMTFVAFCLAKFLDISVSDQTGDSSIIFQSNEIFLPELFHLSSQYSFSVGLFPRFQPKKPQRKAFDLQAGKNEVVINIISDNEVTLTYPVIKPRHILVSIGFWAFWTLPIFGIGFIGILFAGLGISVLLFFTAILYQAYRSFFGSLVGNPLLTVDLLRNAFFLSFSFFLFLIEFIVVWLIVYLNGLKTTVTFHVTPDSLQISQRGRFQRVWNQSIANFAKQDILGINTVSFSQIKSSLPFWKRSISDNVLGVEIIGSTRRLLIIPTGQPIFSQNFDSSFFRKDKAEYFRNVLTDLLS